MRQNMTPEEVDVKLRKFFDAIDNNMDPESILKLRDEWAAAHDQLPPKQIDDVLSSIKVIFRNNASIMEAVDKLENSLKK